MDNRIEMKRQIRDRSEKNKNKKEKITEYKTGEKISVGVNIFL